MQPTPGSSSSQEMFPEAYLAQPTGFEADRDRQSHMMDRLIELSGIGARLQTPEARTEFINGLEPGQFMALISDMNRVLLNVPRKFGVLADQMQVSYEPGSLIPLDLHPAPEDKLSLLEAVLHKSQGMTDLEDKAVMLAVGVNAVHPFVEGNGRVARSLYYLAMHGFTPDDQGFRQVLSEAGEQTICPDPNLLRPAIMGNLKLALNTHQFDTAGDVVPLMQPCVTDATFNPLHTPRGGKPLGDLDQTVVALLLQEDFKCMIPPMALYKHRTPAVAGAIFEQEGQIYFSINEFWKHATDEDIASFYDIFRTLKNTYVHELLKQLSLGEDSGDILQLTDRGTVETRKMALLMKDVVRGNGFDLSAEKNRERLQRIGGLTATGQVRRPTGTPTPQPKMKRAERRQAELEARRKAKRQNRGRS